MSTPAADNTFRKFIEGMEKIRNNAELIPEKVDFDDDLSVSYPQNWQKPSKATPPNPFDKYFKDVFKPLYDSQGLPIPAVPAVIDDNVVDSVLMTDEEKEQAKQKRKPNVVNVFFDVFIGNPSRKATMLNPHVTHSMINSQGNVLYLSHYRNVIQNSIELFNNNIRAAHHNGLPRFVIYSGGTTMAVMKDVELIFYGLVFDDTKIKASFIYYNEPLISNEDVRALLDEIEQTCHFFIVGEFELDESEEHITGLEIEYLDYVNPYRTDRHEPLHRII